MELKESLPPSAVTGARLLRTRMALAGWVNRDEWASNREALARMAAQPVPSASGPPVLVFSFRGWYPHAAWEAVLGHALRVRGVPVHIFNCGGALPLCEVNFRGAAPAVACSECSAYPAAIIEALGLPRSWLRDYLRDDETHRIAETVGRIRDDECAAWEWQGQPIGTLVWDSVLWFLRKSDIAPGGDYKVYRKFLVAGATIASVAPRLLDAVRPRVVLELNGRFFAERILNRFVSPSVPVVTYECGWRRDTLGFDRLSDNGCVDLDAPWAEWMDCGLTTGENEILDRWMDTRAAGDMQRDFYIKFGNAEDRDPLAGLGLNPDLPTAVLFTNLVWDTAVLGKDDAFASIREWLLRTIDIFRARPHWQLVIRVHPAEDLRPSQPSAERLADVVPAPGGLPPNIRVVPSAQTLNSYSLMSRCRATLVYTSTAGLEAALRGRPVVVAARVYYRSRGFTIDVRDAGDYASAVDGAMTTDQSPVQGELARRFAYLLLFRYLKRIPVVRQRARDFPMLDLSEVDDLLPGRSPEFDSLVMALARGGPFV